MKRIISALFLVASLFGAQTAGAVDFNVRIINLSNRIYYTPFLVAAHPAGTSLFTVGQPASASLQAMAEGGDISGLVADVEFGQKLRLPNSRNIVIFGPTLGTKKRMWRGPKFGDCAELRR